MSTSPTLIGFTDKPAWWHGELKMEVVFWWTMTREKVLCVGEEGRNRRVATGETSSGDQSRH